MDEKYVTTRFFFLRNYILPEDLCPSWNVIGSSRAANILTVSVMNCIVSLINDSLLYLLRAISQSHYVLRFHFFKNVLRSYFFAIPPS
jgi:hypothetical protein